MSTKIRDIRSIENEIDELKKSRMKLLNNLIDDGYAKIVYAVEGGDGYYHWVNGNLVIVVSENKEFINNLKFIIVISSYDECNEYEPVGLDHNLLNPPNDMEIIVDVNIDLLTKIIPVIDVNYMNIGR